MSEMEVRVKKAITAGFKMPIHEAHDPHRWLAKCVIEAMRLSGRIAPSGTLIPPDGQTYWILPAAALSPSREDENGHN